MKEVRVKGKKVEKKKERVFIGLIIAFIMISSVLGYFGSQSNAVTVLYNKVKFTGASNGMYTATINKHNFRFNFLPQQLVNMSFNSSVLAPLRQTRLIYITADFKSPLIQSISESEYLFGQNLMQMGIYAIGGYTTNTTTGLPRITCGNATVITPVMIFEYANRSSVRLENQCIHVAAGNRFDFLALKDRIIFSLLGILR